MPRTRNGELVIQEGIRFDDHIIWGATYRMLRNFMDVAGAREPASAGCRRTVDDAAAWDLPRRDTTMRHAAHPRPSRRIRRQL